MLGSSPVVAFVPSTDLGRSRAFYEDLLGLAVSEVGPYALVLAGGGTTIRLAKVDELVPRPFTVLGWIVTDMKKAVEGLTVRSVEFIRYAGMEQDADGIWTTPGGDRIAWFKDPDGNTLSLTQLA
jgi:catechol 2,3-dioxygenase-like lactoylglutathione lyase family enzyme